MIRRATFQDLDRVKVLIREMHAASKYRGHVDVSEKVMGEVLCSMLAAQRSPVQGGSFFHVAEHRGRVEGFMVGVLDRVYQIGNRLAAHDLFLHVSSEGRGADAAQLVAAYIAWAQANPRVLEIKLSWGDTLPGAERVARLYARKGFRRCGETWERWTEIDNVRAAA